MQSYKNTYFHIKLIIIDILVYIYFLIVLSLIISVYLKY